MPLVAAAVVPHSPLLIDRLAGHHRQLFHVTHAALGEIGADLRARQPDLVVLLTPHGPLINNRPTLNVAEKYVGRMIEFGDQHTHIQVPGDPRFAQLCADVAEQFDVELPKCTRLELDYGCTVPWSWLFGSQSPMKILPLAVAHQSPEELLNLGRVLEELCHQTKLRLAIVTSADLLPRAQRSHERPLAEERTIGEAIGRTDPSPLLSIQLKDVCGLAPIIVLLSSLRRAHSIGTVQSFQAPLSVGLLTASFEIPT